jgi:hypothetical protein
MSSTADLTLIVRASQKAQAAAEGALAITERLAADFGHRLSAIEGRFSSLEGRVTVLAAGLDSVHRAVLRIADTQFEHSATLADHTARFDAIDQALAAILAKLP